MDVGRTMIVFQLLAYSAKLYRLDGKFDKADRNYTRALTYARKLILRGHLSCIPRALSVYLEFTKMRIRYKRRRFKIF